MDCIFEVGHEIALFLTCVEDSLQVVLGRKDPLQFISGSG